MKTIIVRRKVLPKEINKYESEMYDNYYGKISTTTVSPSKVADKHQSSKKHTIGNFQPAAISQMVLPMGRSPSPKQESVDERTVAKTHWEKRNPNDARVMSQLLKPRDDVSIPSPKKELTNV